MFPKLKRALCGLHAPVRCPIPPCSACVRTVFCTHLRVIWRVMLFLTVLYVMLHLLSAVGQIRNSKSRASDHNLINTLLVGQLDDQSIMESFKSSKVTFHHSQWKDRKDEGPRHLASTSKMIVTPKLPSRTNSVHEPREEDQEVPRQSQVNNVSQESLWKRFPKPRPSGQTHDFKQTPSLMTSKQNDICRPRHHVFFLKTHKTGSSTILNILYRYGDTRNLTFALPVSMYNQLFYPHFFEPQFVEGMKSDGGAEFHIMCNHMRFRGPQVREVMPADTFYFSILRNPVCMMNSLFTYYKTVPAFVNFTTVEDFLLDNGRSYNATLPDNHYARNILTFDFGFNSSALSELDEYATAIISTIETEFHLILITEYFDESMVLLRHELCWSLEDVVSFRLNSRGEKSCHPFSEEMVERVKKWSSLDWRLYQHFNASFWRRIDTSLGRTKLREEVELLRARTAELEKSCLLEGKAVDPAEVHDLLLMPMQHGQAVIRGYNIRPGLDNDMHSYCQRLIMPEVQYTKSLYIKQFPDLAAKMMMAEQS